MAMKNISDRQVLLAQQRYQRDTAGRWGYEILSEETGECLKVCFNCLKRAADRGLIEYGVSVRTGWITEKGQALI